MSRRILLCQFILFATASACTKSGPSGGFEAIRTIPASEARQGVAVDETNFYAVDNRAIGKYDRRTGAPLDRWEAGDDERIAHLNSGAIIDGKLYCAHSNYPVVPMASSIEVFETAQLRHSDTHAFRGFEGSATWVDRHDGSWWVGFANYAGRGGEPGRGPDKTFVVRFDPTWTVEARYRFPAAVIERFGAYSNSGGAWGHDGLLYTTGHDAAELYVVKLPPQGDELVHVQTIPAAIEGQGIAWDPFPTDTLFGIVKGARAVVMLQQGN